MRKLLTDLEVYPNIPPAPCQLSVEQNENDIITRKLQNGEK